MGTETSGFASMKANDPKRFKKVSASGGEATSQDLAHMRRIARLGVEARRRAMKKKPKQTK